jgi:cytochrome c oxidase subunit 2
MTDNPVGGGGTGGESGGGSVEHLGASAGGSSPTHERDRVHWKRLGVIWLVEMAVMEPILWFFLYPHFPPGRLTSAARGDQFDGVVVTMLANAAVAAVIIFLIYAMIMWRQHKDEPLVDGPPLRSHKKVQFWWVFLTSGIVIGAFCFGTYELIVPNGAGSGEGPSPIWTPSSKNILPIQVIGQQWYWTYRYPTFGGFETTQLLLPVDTQIAFHVTSLDVVHDWWAYQLGVKADANPGEDNVAFADTGPKHGAIVVRCDELCGIWHGAMYNYGGVVSKAYFMKWGRRMEKKLAPLTKLLPKFAWTYWPSANGAGAGYYPSQDPLYQYYRYYAGYAGKEGNLPAVHVKASNTAASQGRTSDKSPFISPSGKSISATSSTPPRAGHVSHLRRHGATVNSIRKTKLSTPHRTPRSSTRKRSTR